MPDILSLFVSSEAALRFIKKAAKVTYVLLIGNVLLTLFSLADWYRYIDTIPTHFKGSLNQFNYIAWPVIYMVDILVILSGSIYNYKGFALLKDIEIAVDDELIGKAFKYFYYAYMLFCIGTCVLLIDRASRFFI